MALDFIPPTNRHERRKQVIEDRVFVKKIREALKPLVGAPLDLDTVVRAVLPAVKEALKTTA